MSDNTYKPAGYCPHCGYAIDPGVCPECGKTVSPAEMDKKPHQFARRRAVKRAGVAVVVLSLIVGGWYVYAYCNWLSLIPSDLLLAVHDGEYGRAAVELWGRFDKRALSSEQVDRLMAEAVKARKGLVVRSPHPSDIDIQVRADVEKAVFCPGWTLVCVDREVLADGQPVKYAPGFPFPDYAATGLRTPKDRLCMRIPPMAPGSHEIQVASTYELWPDSAVKRQTRSPVKFVLRLAGRVLVEDKPVTSYIGLAWGPGYGSRTGARLVAPRVGGLGGMGGLAAFHFDTADPVAAKVEYRLSGTTTYQQGGSVACPPGKHGVGVALPFVAKLTPGTRFDVRLVPDITTAWYSDFTTCFGGTIEWLDVPVGASQPVTYPAQPPATKFLLPTRVYQATATTGAQ